MSIKVINEKLTLQFTTEEEAKLHADNVLSKTCEEYGYEGNKAWFKVRKIVNTANQDRQPLTEGDI